MIDLVQCGRFSVVQRSDLYNGIFVPGAKNIRLLSELATIDRFVWRNAVKKYGHISSWGFQAAQFPLRDRFWCRAVCVSTISAWIWQLFTNCSGVAARHALVLSRRARCAGRLSLDPLAVGSFDGGGDPATLCPDNRRTSRWRKGRQPASGV